MSDFVVLQEHPSLLVYIDQLQKKNAEQLSFYPKQVFEREQANGRLFLGMLNGQPCGYIYVGAPGVDVKCHQVCIEYDARRRTYGLGLVSVLEQYANDCKASSITLRCGFDLEANEFWRAAGYECISNVVGGIRRNRTINVWRKQLLPELFQTVAIEPARGNTNASVWTKNKHTGLVTQFIRGKRMEEYRAIVIAKSIAGAAL